MIKEPFEPLRTFLENCRLLSNYKTKSLPLPTLPPNVQFVDERKQQNFKF